MAKEKKPLAAASSQQTHIHDAISQDFPRGGASELTPLEYRDISDKVKEDFLLGNNESQTPVHKSSAGSDAASSKKSNKRQASSNDNKISVAKKSKVDTPASVTLLSHKRLNVGMCMIGVIREINSLDLAVSLPNQLTGFVSLTEISEYISNQVEAAVDSDDEDDDDTDMDNTTGNELNLPTLSSYFTVGQIVICKIISLTQAAPGKNGDHSTSKKRRIDLSLKPETVNEELEKADLVPGMVIPCSVTSKEDHGYLLSFGIDGASGFLKKAHAEAYLRMKNISQLEIGSILMCSILSAGSASRVISVSIDPTHVATSQMKQSEETKLSHIRPGAFVTAVVDEALENGLGVSVFKFFKGTIDWFHLPAAEVSSEDISSRFKKGQKIKPRVLYVDLARKKIGLTLSSTLVALNAPDFSGFEIGSIAKNVSVLRVDPSVGLLVQYPGGRIGYVHISRLTDDHTTKIEKAFRVGSIHPGRIIGHDLCDNLLLLSFASEVLSQPFLRFQDIKAGVEVKGHVLRIIPAGVMVAVTDFIRGLCPSSHFSDAKITKPEKLFKEGATMSFQVLSVDPVAKRLILTHRKSLLESKFPPILSYADAKIGQIATGIITSVKPFGCIVTFHGNVHAIVPLSKLSDSRVEDPMAHFKVGQAIKCQIVSINITKEKMCASFNLNSEKTIDAPISAVSTLSIGQTYDGTVTSKTSIAVVLKVNECVSVSVTKAHLSDFPSHSQKLFDSLNTGSFLSGLLVLAINKRGVPTLSRKSSLISQVQRDGSVKQLSDFTVGQLISGFVRNIHDKSCFIEFPGGIIGVASLHNISNNFVSNIADHVQIGQSVLAYVSNIDLDNSRLSVSLKASHLELSPNFPEMELERLRSFISEYSLLGSVHLDSSTVKPPTLGQVVEGTIETKTKYGYVVQLKSGGQGLINRLNKELDIKSVVQCRVLDYDPVTRIADLMVISPGTTTGTLKQHLQAAQKSQTTGESVEACVELIKEYYAVVSSPKLQGALSYCLVKGPNSLTGKSMRCNVGDKVQIQIKMVPKWSTDQTCTLQQRILALPSVVETPAKDTKPKRALQNPVDPSVTDLESIVAGMFITCVVRSVKDTQINIRIADNLNGRIQATEIFDSLDSISDLKSPMNGFKPKQTIKAKVIGFHNTKTHSYLPISHNKSINQTVVELTVRPSELADESASLVAYSERRPKFETLAISSEHIGFIQRIDAEFLRVLINGGLLGNVANIDASDNIDAIENLDTHFTIGQAVKCFVTSKNDAKKLFNMSLVAPTPLEIESIAVGQKVIGRITRIDPLKGVMIRISGKISGRVHVTDINDVFTESPTSEFKLQQVVQAVVLSVNRASGSVSCSLRKSVVASDSPPTPLSLASLKQGDVTSGYIRDISEKGCFVSLSSDIHARVKMSELSDEFVVDWKSAFKPGMLVQGKVLGIDVGKRQVELSFKRSLLSGGSANMILFEDLKVGQKLKGSIKRIESYGLFIAIQNSTLSGLCHSSEVADRPVQNLERLYSVGDSVMAIVLKLNAEKNRIYFGLKSSYFNDTDADTGVCEEDTESVSDGNILAESDTSALDEVSENESVSGEEVAFDSDEDVPPNDSDDSMEEEDGDNSEGSDSEGDYVELGQDDDMEVDPPQGSIQPLSVPEFSWDSQTAMDMLAINKLDSEDSEEENQEDVSSDESDYNKNKRSRRAKKRERADKEKQILKEELSLVDGDHPPEVAEDYERLLLSSPNNSYIWIKYIVFHLNLAEIDKGRQVAERALKSINFREEQERLNIWVAFLNLENTYGTLETLAKILERAIQMNDAKTVYFHMAKIYERTGKDDMCIKLYQTMCKKFKESLQVWMDYARFLITHGKEDAARQLLSRSMQSLPKRKHGDAACKFAQLEFKQGEPERGRTIFEGLMSSCPKRTDLWSVYLDMEIRAGDLTIVRRLFDRVLEGKWSPRKMKYFSRNILSLRRSMEMKRVFIMLSRLLSSL
ncbi:hypothetical protein BASA83_006903 [Batrachochytrium salamandrivorans]|nr:hypothetical protein BASA83_006903 [Batrachochytrium salamandrivorans]